MACRVHCSPVPRTLRMLEIAVRAATADGTSYSPGPGPAQSSILYSVVNSYGLPGIGWVGGLVQRVGETGFGPGRACREIHTAADTLSVLDTQTIHFAAWQSPGTGWPLHASLHRNVWKVAQFLLLRLLPAHPAAVLSRLTSCPPPCGCISTRALRLRPRCRQKMRVQMIRHLRRALIRRLAVESQPALLKATANTQPREKRTKRPSQAPPMAARANPKRVPQHQTRLPHLLRPAPPRNPACHLHGMF